MLKDDEGGGSAGDDSTSTHNVRSPKMNRPNESRAPRVKNRAPAAIQITAEQLLREAQERQETAFRAPKQRVEDFEELHEYRGRKRKEFEDRVRRTRGSVRISYIAIDSSSRL